MTFEEKKENSVLLYCNTEEQFKKTMDSWNFIIYINDKIKTINFEYSLNGIKYTLKSIKSNYYKDIAFLISKSFKKNQGYIVRIYKKIKDNYNNIDKLKIISRDIIIYYLVKFIEEFKGYNNERITKLEKSIESLEKRMEKVEQIEQYKVKNKKFIYHGNFDYRIDYDEENDYLYLKLLNTEMVCEDGNDYFNIFKKIVQIDFPHFLKDKKKIIQTIDKYHYYVFSLSDDLEKIYNIIENK